MARKKIDPITETKVLTESRRKCALCVGLSGDFGEKEGQIAHLDKNSGNNSFDNLCFLCLAHHSKYDSITSQHKNYTIHEVKEYRVNLYNTLKRENIDKVIPAPHNSLKPFFFRFNGINSFLRYNSEKLKASFQFILEIEFRLPNTNYGGVIFNLINSEKSNYLYLIYKSVKHPFKPNEITLMYYSKGKGVELFSFNYEFSDWANVIFDFSSQELVLVFGGRRSSMRNINIKDQFDRIEIGGTLWNNEIGAGYSESKRQSTYTLLELRSFKVLSGSELIGNLDFSYGNEYFLKTASDLDVTRYGGQDFSKSTIGS